MSEAKIYKRKGEKVNGSINSIERSKKAEWGKRE